MKKLNFIASFLFTLALLTSACIIPVNVRNSEAKNKNTQNIPSPSTQKDSQIISSPLPKTENDSLALKPVISNDITKIEDLVFKRTNEERAKEGLPALKYDEGLARLARNHSKDMIDNNFFSHTNLQGMGPSERKNKFYPELFGGILENIFNESGSFSSENESIAETIISGWMSSPGHKANILNKEISHLGVGVSKTIDKLYATQNFADAQALIQQTIPQNLKNTSPLSLKFKFIGKFQKERLSIFVDFPDKTKRFYLPDRTFYTGTGKYSPEWDGENFSIIIDCSGNGDYKIKMGVDNTFYDNGLVFNWICQ